MGRGSDPAFAYKHLLSAYFKPKFSSPQRAATGTIPKCKIPAGSSGPQEADGQDQNSSWQGHIGYWRPTHAGKSVRLLQSLPQGRATLALPHIPWVGGGQKEEGHIFHLTSATGHRAAPSPSSLPPPTSGELQAMYRSTSLLPESLGHPRGWSIKVKPSSPHALLCDPCQCSPAHALRSCQPELQAVSHSSVPTPSLSH